MATNKNMTTIHRSIMDPRHFDLVVKHAVSTPRRRVLKGLLSAILVGVPGALRPKLAGAERCTRAGKRCSTNGECCSGFCEPISRQCVARCTAGSGICATDGGPAPCAKGCSCYFVELDDIAGRACLRNPTKDLTTPGQECPGTAQCSREAEDRGGCPCSSPADCPRGYLCTASSCCQPDSVCLRLCEPTRG